MGQLGDCPACDKPATVQYAELEDVDQVPLIVYIVFALGILVITVGYWFASGK